MNVFPTGLDNSLFPAIFVGVGATFIATETLGWTFTGLVVPGYLSSVALVAPRAAVLMVLEALLTLVVTRALSDGLARVGAGSRFFGRERFFLTLAVATGVRLFAERVVLVAIAQHTGKFAVLAVGQGDVAAHSIGLVLVPLIAHTLDKVGAARGLLQLGVLSSVTGGALLLLERVTNLTLANLTLTFEDVAFSLEQSPHAYVVMLAAALLAARANVSFGWDFHGIIVPGLLAVAWFTPGKVVVTLAEAVAAYALARAFLRLPVLRSAQVEGPRRLILVFVADAVLRVTVIALLGPRLPLVQASDLYGFGYLLPTLLAVKIWQRHSVGRVLLPATQVSLGGFLAGHVVILVFSRAMAFLAPLPPAVAAPPAAATTFERAVVGAWAYVARDGEKTRLSSAERSRWDGALGRFAAGEAPGSAFAPLEGRVALVPLGDDPGGLVIREAAGELDALTGAGVLVARASGRRVVLAVPRPLAGALPAATDVARALDARAVIVAGRPEADTGSLTLRSTPYGLARRRLAAGDVWVELRVDAGAPAAGELRVPVGAWPEALDVAALKGLLPGLRVTWTGDGPVELSAPETTWAELAARPCAAATREPQPASLATLKALGPDRDGDLDLAERLVYGELVVAPLLRAALGDGDAAPACRAAAALGLRAATLRDAAGRTYLAALPGARAAAAAVLRVGPARPDEQVFGAPRVDAEPFAAAAAAALFEAADGRALLLGAGVWHGPPPCYDVALATVTVALGEAAVALDVRGAGEGAAPLLDGAVLTWGGIGGSPDSTPTWVAPLEAAAARVGLPARRWRGDLDDDCCGDLQGVRRARMAPLGHARQATLFLSTAAREARWGLYGVESAVTLAAALGVPRLDATLAEALAAARAETTCSPAEESFGLARRWAEIRHVADLRALAARPGVRVAVDRVTGEGFVLVSSRCAGALALGVVNLRDPGEAAAPTHVLAPGAAPDAELLDRLRLGGLLALWAPALPEEAGP